MFLSSISFKELNFINIAKNFINIPINISKNFLSFWFQIPILAEEFNWILCLICISLLLYEYYRIKLLKPVSLSRSEEEKDYIQNFMERELSLDFSNSWYYYFLALGGLIWNSYKIIEYFPQFWQNKLSVVFLSLFLYWFITLYLKIFYLISYDFYESKLFDSKLLPLTENVVFSETIRRNWFLCNLTFCSHFIFTLGKNFIIYNWFSFVGIGTRDIQISYSWINIILIGILGILISRYLISVAFKAKSSDILGDESQNSFLMQVDKMCDISADGTFSKLILLFLIEILAWSYPHQALKLGMLSLSSILVWCLCWFWNNHLISGFLNLDQINKNIVWFLIISLSFDPRNLNSLIIALLIMALTSKKFIIRFKDLITKDVGFNYLFPFLSASLIHIIPFFLSLLLPIGNHISILQFEYIPLLFILDQSGFVFDIFGDKRPEIDNLDLLGNQFKALWKFFMVRLVIEPVFHHHFNLTEGLFSDNILIIGAAFLFWKQISKLKDLKEIQLKDFYNNPTEYLNFGILILLTLTHSIHLPLCDTLILHGAIADNLKKSFQLKFITAEPNIQERAEYIDQVGDFTKDFLYPVVISSILLTLVKVSLFELWWWSLEKIVFFFKF